jgi:hypothetical protein
MKGSMRWIAYTISLSCALFAVLLSLVAAPRYEPIFAMVMVVSTMALLLCVWLFRSDPAWRWRLAIPSILAAYALLDTIMRLVMGMRPLDMI